MNLALGVLAAAMYFFALLLGLRRRLLHLRVGSMARWRTLHLWIGGLSFPIALVHARFEVGGAITTALLIASGAAVGSGLIGALLQRVLPRVMTAVVPREIAIDQMDRVLTTLRNEAYELVWASCGAAPEVPGEVEAIAEQLGVAPRAPRVQSTVARGGVTGQDAILRLYRERLVPYIRSPFDSSLPLASENQAVLAFEAVRGSISPSLEPALERLAGITEQVRLAARQARIQRWLDGWLVVHIPFSVASALLIAIHAVTALYY